MDFGFLIVGTSSDVEFRLSGLPNGQNVFANLSVARADDSVTVLAGRLHYRDEAMKLTNRQSSPQLAEEFGTNDAALALGVYLLHGLEGLARLEGDFAIAIFDAQRGHLVARRDPFGAYPLFWTKINGTIGLSTSLKSLLDLRPSRAISMDHLADFLMLPTSACELATEECAYEDITRVMPDTIVTINLLSGKVQRQMHWKWRDRAVHSGTNNLDEIACEYVTLLRAAVRERIRGSTGSHLSGGMDSTSISLLALDLIQSGFGNAPLHAMSLVFEELPTLARERPYVESVLSAGYEGMLAHRVEADHLVHFGTLADPPLHDEPFAGLWCMHAEGALIDKAGQIGVTSLLTGTGGDDLLDIMPFHLTDLIRQGRFLQAWREACAWAHARGSTPWRILYLFGLLNLLPSSRYGILAKSYIFGRQRALSKFDDWTMPAWIRRSFAQRHALAERSAHHASQMFRKAQSTQMSLAIHGIDRRVGDPYRWILAAPRGIALSHPFLDPRVVSFALGVQARPADPYQVKPILAAAMRGILPEPIRTRRDKRSFNELYYVGLSKHLPQLKALVRDSPDIGMIDKDILIDCMEEAALGVADTRRLQRMNLTLSLLAWLSKQTEWQSRQHYWRRTFCVPLRRTEERAAVRFS